MSKKIKVLHIEERFHPTMGYQINFFAKYSSDRFQLHILTSKSLSIWNTTVQEIAEADEKFEKEFNVKIDRVDALLERKNKRNILLKGIKKYIYRVNPDIIYFHAIENFTSFLFFLNIHKYKKYKIVTDTHTLYNQFKTSISARTYDWLFRKVIIPKINKYNVISFGTVPENIEILIKKYGIKPELVYELPIGTDFEQYHFSEKDRNELRNKYHLTRERLAILYVGKFDFNKKPHLIPEAVKQIENKLKTPIKLFFIGPKIP